MRGRPGWSSVASAQGLRHHRSRNLQRNTLRPTSHQRRHRRDCDDAAHVLRCELPRRIWIGPVVSEVPEALRRLNVLLEATFVAHETIYDLYSDLVQVDRATPTTQSLLAESARIVLHSAPAASAASRRLANQWHEQSLLDPDAAENTALELETELAHAEPVLRALLDRETAIAAQLKALTAEER